MNKIQLEILTPMRRYPTVGAIIATEVDHAGVIKDDFLRRRLRDSVNDNCVQLVDKERDNDTQEIDKKKTTKIGKEKAPTSEDSPNV